MLNLTLTSPSSDEQSLNDDCFQLIQDLKNENISNAEFPESSGPSGTKGAEVAISQLVLTFISSGAAVALFEVIKTYLQKSSDLDISFENNSGSKVQLSSKNIKSKDAIVVIQELRELINESNNN